MPSPRKGRGKGYYKRKGGSIKGKYSRHKPELDRKRKAKKGTRKQVHRYPQAYD
jgi:hypothetical protein